MYSVYESCTELALWMFSVVLYEMEAGLFDCVPEGQGVPSFIQHKPRFRKLFCAFRKALNAHPWCNAKDENGEEFAAVHMLRSQEMLLSLLKWHHMKTCKVSGLSGIWERICECHHSFLKTTKRLRSL